MFNFKITYPETPKGKRSVKKNVYGNVNGYVSGKRFYEFGFGINAESDAKRWLDGESIEQVRTT